jgi:hypothetical protein
MAYFQKQSSLLGMLCCLTVLLIGAQCAFFFTHYQVDSIADSLANSAIYGDFFNFIILFPLLINVCIQFLLYGLFVAWLYFMAKGVGEFFNF